MVTRSRWGTPPCPRGLLLAALAVSGCSLSPVVASSGGIDGEDGGGGMGCPRALVVTDSDYMSTNVSVVSTTGSLLAPSLISSAASPPGLSEALSNDVVPPLAAPASGALVLIDRGNSAIDWIDASTAAVQAQLSVATGFYANPQDYLEVAHDKAYVSRFQTNTTPGKEPLDEGGDVVILDLGSHTLTGRIDMTDPDDTGIWPSPYRMLAVGDQVWVSLERYSDKSYMVAGEARIAGIDPATNKRTFEVDVPGLVACGGLALSPSGKTVAAACGGPGGIFTNVATSGIALLDATKNPPVVLKTFAMTDAQVAPTIAFVSETLLVGVAFGDYKIMPPRNDVAFTLDTTTGKVKELFTAGGSFVLGDVRCTAGCANECAMADAYEDAVRFWSIHEDGALVTGPVVNVDPTIGLPPRGLGALGSAP